jgi:hypothetical protein
MPRDASLKLIFSARNDDMDFSAPARPPIRRVNLFRQRGAIQEMLIALSHYLTGR